MKRFKRHKTFDEIKAQCEAAGIHFSDHLYKVTGADFVVITTIEGNNNSGQVLYNTVTGAFFGTTPDDVSFDSDKDEHENEPWFQALLLFFYEEVGT
jgi:hypothetical protein